MCRLLLSYHQSTKYVDIHQYYLEHLSTPAQYTMDLHTVYD